MEGGASSAVRLGNGHQGQHVTAGAQLRLPGHQTGPAGLGRGGSKTCSIVSLWAVRPRSAHQDYGSSRWHVIARRSCPRRCLRSCLRRRDMALSSGRRWAAGLAPGVRARRPFGSSLRPSLPAHRLSRLGRAYRECRGGSLGPRHACRPRSSSICPSPPLPAYRLSRLDMTVKAKMGGWRARCTAASSSSVRWSWWARARWGLPRQAAEKLAKPSSTEQRSCCLASHAASASAQTCRVLTHTHAPDQAPPCRRQSTTGAGRGRRRPAPPGSSSSASAHGGCPAGSKQQAASRGEDASTLLLRQEARLGHVVPQPLRCARCAV